MIQWLRHAFAVEPQEFGEPTVDERRLVDRLCTAIIRRGLVAPALMALECSHPLNFLGSQFLLFAAPIAEVIFPREDYRTLIGFLERRGSVEYVCRRLEQHAARRGASGRGPKADRCDPAGASKSA